MKEFLKTFLLALWIMAGLVGGFVAMYGVAMGLVWLAHRFGGWVFYSIPALMLFSICFGLASIVREQ